MPKVWNIGNTTVRNPKRIETALKVFMDGGFSGNVKGAESEQRLHFVLREQGVLDYEGEPSDLNGRKWRAAFYQLGFIAFEEYKIAGKKLSVLELFKAIGQEEVISPYQLTKAGKKLINATTVPEIEEIYTRQFACFELPTTIEGGFKDGKMKPFILFLQVLSLLNKNGLAGLNKFETGFFLQPFQEHRPELPDEIVKGILKYRNEIGSVSTSKEVKRIQKGYLDQLGEISGINPLSVVGDYADTTFRYFSLSGLFARAGDTIIIRPSKERFVNLLLKNEPSFTSEFDPITYFTYFYSNSYPLPVDSKSFVLTEIQDLSKSIKDPKNPLLPESQNASEADPLQALQTLRTKLIVYNSWEREEEYAIEQRTDKSLEDILMHLRFLNNEGSLKLDIDDKPAYLEWAVWRSFLAINDLTSKAHESRRFPVDFDFLPRNTAPGGGADLIFEFTDYVLVVEVTLTKSHRQMAVESEPVRRHTVQYKDLYPKKDVYCLFIAPEVDNNVVETFRIGVWYKGDAEEFVNVIPMSISDFIKTIDHRRKKQYHNTEFKALLDKCLISRNYRAPQWKSSINREVENWIAKG